MLPMLAAAALPFAIPDSEVVDLPTAANGIDYQLYVHVPPACREEAAQCPAVYTLDAEYSFGLASLISTHLADRQRMPHVITVSIGYQDKSQYRPNRTRDYTPFPSYADSSEPNFRGSGHGEAFRMVIREEIIPFVEANYHTAPQGRTLVGHSYGGLFAVTTLLDEPDLFDNFIVVSPSLWYGDSRILRRAQEEPAPARATPAKVYLAVGEWEEQPENNRVMVSLSQAFAKRMEEWGDSAVAYEIAVMPEETHASVFPAALSNGLRKIYGVAFNTQ